MLIPCEYNRCPQQICHNIWPVLSYKRKSQSNATTPPNQSIENMTQSLMMMILGVSPLRGFPEERRGIGHLVPILCGRRLAGLVRLGGGVCPSAGCPVGTVGQLVGPAPTLHSTLGGRQASAGYGPASGASVSAQPSAGRTRAWWPHRDTTSR